MAFARIKRLGSWYSRNERIISRFSLIGGFVFNVFTLTRVDRFIENFWVIVHLLVVAACIILIDREENEGVKNINDPAQLHFWLVNILQFAFGGLLSTFIVFYLRSAVITVVWPFFLVLVAAFIANESFKKHYSRISFQIAFFFLSTYLFLIFFIPVLIHQIGQQVFLISGGIAVLVLLGFLAVLKRFTKEGFRKARKELLSAVAGIFIVVNALYFLNLIPPLPLALTDAGVYHSISRRPDSTYVVTYEPGNFWNKLLPYVNVYPTFHTTPNGLAYAYTAIFSPVDFSTKLTHEWQYYDPAAKKWETSATVDISVSGGRAQGFRTYSINSGLITGKWRVNVKTATGQIVGRLSFNVVVEDTAPATETLVKD